MADLLTCLFREGEPGGDHPVAHPVALMRSRNVSHNVLVGQLEVPAPPARLVADWEQEIAEQLQLVPGDVECLPWARTQARWPALRQCVQAVREWTQALSMGDVLTDAEVALMACRGARYHHDGLLYGGSAFCNVFLSEDRGLDLHFAGTGQRIPLVRGTAVVFDTCQPHAVIDRANAGFTEGDFPPERDCSQMFLTWELPLGNARVANVLGVRFASEPCRVKGSALEGSATEGQVLLHGTPSRVCEYSGRWFAV